MRVGDDLPRDRADQPALKQRVASVPHDDVVNAMSLGKAQDLLRRMAYRDVDVNFEGFVQVSVTTVTLASYSSDANVGGSAESGLITPKRAGICA